MTGRCCWMRRWELACQRRKLQLSLTTPPQYWTRCAHLSSCVGAYNSGTNAPKHEADFTDWHVFGSFRTTICCIDCFKLLDSNLCRAVDRKPTFILHVMWHRWRGSCGVHTRPASPECPTSPSAASSCPVLRTPQCWSVLLPPPLPPDTCRCTCSAQHPRA